MTDTRPSAELLAFQAAVAGRYSIEHELGRGGMGIVFLAREVALDRPVALKLLPPEMAARPGVRERFLTEARTAARLSHPHIVQIYAVDEAAGFVFFAMAYVDGGTLGDRIRTRGPLSNSEAARLLREVSWALGHAHLQGVVHRDVKPDNILLDASSGRALVTDFGIAVVAEQEQERGDAARPDPAGSPAGPDAVRGDGARVVGTAEFMSPEQARGAAVDARSDLYSLACVGFYALSGRVPFDDASASAVLVKHLREPAPPVLSVAPHAPPAVATALDRCLRKNPEQRFQGADALAQALEGDREKEKELPVPLRVFIRQSREWETTVAWCGFGLVFLGPTTLIMWSQGFGDGGLMAALGVIALLVGIPLASLVRIARRLLQSGYSRDDGALAFQRDVEKKDEEYRFQVGERVTRFDRVLRWAKRLGFGTAAVAMVMSLVLVDGEGWLYLFSGSLQVGLVSMLLSEVRARLRGDIMGERLERFWKSVLGKATFKLGGLNLGRVAPVLSGMHRPTEVVIGLEADRLFAELPKDVQRTLAGLPDTVRALEEDAQAMRRQVAEMDAILAEIGDDDPSLPSAAERARVRLGVEATREEAKAKLQKAVAALETIRLGLLYMHAGTGTVESLTRELEAARDLSDDMSNLLAGHREVARILGERRRTGTFRLVTDP